MATAIDRDPQYATPPHWAAMNVCSSLLLFARVGPRRYSNAMDYSQWSALRPPICKCHGRLGPL